MYITSDDSTGLSRTGIVFAATGEQFAREAMSAIRSLREKMPDSPVTLFSDRKRATLWDLGCHQIEIPSPRYDYMDKIFAIQHSPYRWTLYLDADTQILNDVSHLFQVLERFELAFCHDISRKGSCDEFSDITPAGFSEPNTGVILYDQESANVRQCFEDWSKIYERQRQTACVAPHDQPAFRKAVYDSSVRIHILPPEYNVRTHKPCYVDGLAMILHGRGDSVTKAARDVNRDFKGPRIYDFGRGWWEKVYIQLRWYIRRITGL